MFLDRRIIWKKDAVLVNCTQEELSKIFEYFRENGKECSSKDNLEEWHSSKLTYKVDTRGKYTYLFTYGSKYNYDKYKTVYAIYSTNNFDDNKNKHTTDNQGLNASILVEKKFKEQYDMTLRKAFGYSDESIKYCVPRQFYYTNTKRLGLTEEASSIDISSHYPSNLCGSLPDWHTRVEYSGTIAPTEEYPFAFYVKSGHCAEYNRFDTHKWIYHKLNLYLFDVKSQPTLAPEEDITILCKASNCELTEVMRYYYNLKLLGDPDAKLVMNAFIGNCHTNVYRTFKMAHVASICLARANDRLLNIVDSMWFDNIIQICVDGIIYKGNKHIADSNTGLGKIKEEFNGCKIYVRAMNNYIVEKDGKFIIAKHGGCNAWNDGSKITTEEQLLKDIKHIDDCNKWKRIDYLEVMNNGKKN